jgi:HPr kinase/phosphorylase
MEQVYATAVAYHGFGVLIRGPSGSGKSDLALRLIEDGAKLIADDQVNISAVRKELYLSPPDSISGLIEVRGFGVIKIGAVRDIKLRLIVDLDPSYETERTPTIKEELIKNITVPVTNMKAFESSILARIKLILGYLEKNIELIS